MKLTIGNAQLWNGDCLELMQDIPDGSVDMVLCDPPYGTTACKWDSVIPFEPMWTQLKRAIKPKGAIVFHAAQPFTSALIMSNTKMFRYSLVWIKNTQTNGMNANKHPLNNMEDICVFYSKHGTYNPQMTQGKPYKMTRNKPKIESVYGTTGTKDGFIKVSDGSRYPKRTLEIKVERGFHPTQKPTPLAEYLIKTYTNPYDTILDFTMGSGTTGVACSNLNRSFIGIELDKKYFNIAVNRIQSAQPAQQLSA